MPKNQPRKHNQTLVDTMRKWLHYQFNLGHDKLHEPQIIEDIQETVEFRGSNLWTLIFAILIASIGLNMNSTAVVIGAMLISPIMAPIIGVGVGVGINDFNLIKKSFRNLGVATVISLVTSTLYFSITPLHDASSELLSRTTPAIWDVFIAFFGGLAGIVAFIKKQKNNVIPGVAIATALMPPLCTAGYGIATANFSFFIGAFYLYFINSMFIAIATFLMIRYQKFSRLHFLDPRVDKKVRRSIAILVLLTIGPSVFMAYRIVDKSIYERNAMQFINQEFNFPSTQIVSRSVDSNIRRIQILLFGDKLDDEMLDMIKHKMSFYGLTETDLEIRQDVDKSTPIDYNAIKTGLLEDLYKENGKLLAERAKKIDSLQHSIDRIMQSQTWPIKSISEELYSMVGSVDRLAISPSVFYSADSNRYDTVLTAYIKMIKRPSPTQVKQITNWLKARTQNDSIRVILE